MEPMPDFDMNKMLGIWYVVQKTSTASHCLTYNITRGEDPGEYEIEQVSQHFILGLTPLKHDYRYTGTIKTNDPSMPGKMRVRFPLSVGGSASYTVFITDYTGYAGIFTCQKLTFAHRQSASILSRRRDLDKDTIDKIRNRLSRSGVDPYDLSIINQNDCPKHPDGAPNGVNIDIDPDTFSAHNIAGVVKKAGEKIGDGIEYVAGAGKTVYNKLAHSDDKNGKLERERESEEASNVALFSRNNPDLDAEWMP